MKTTSDQTFAKKKSVPVYARTDDADKPLNAKINHGRAKSQNRLWRGKEMATTYETESSLFQTVSYAEESKKKEN